jgi:hypothetical protein
MKKAMLLGGLMAVLLVAGNTEGDPNAARRSDV